MFVQEKYDTSFHFKCQEGGYFETDSYLILYDVFNKNFIIIVSFFHIMKPNCQVCDISIY
jgi:hypothetical protein